MRFTSQTISCCTIILLECLLNSNDDDVSKSCDIQSRPVIELSQNWRHSVNFSVNYGEKGNALDQYVVKSIEENFGGCKVCNTKGTLEDLELCWIKLSFCWEELQTLTLISFYVCLKLRFALFETWRICFTCSIYANFVVGIGGKFCNVLFLVIIKRGIVMLEADFQFPVISHFSRRDFIGQITSKTTEPTSLKFQVYFQLSLIAKR